MAGSLNHIVDENGMFTMSMIENMGDAWEALEECFDIIAILSDGDAEKLKSACEKARGPAPKAVPIFGSRAPD